MLEKNYIKMLQWINISTAYGLEPFLIGKVSISSWCIISTDELQQFPGIMDTILCDYDSGFFYLYGLT